MRVQTWGTKLVYHRERGHGYDRLRFLLTVSLFENFGRARYENLVESAKLRHAAQFSIFRLIMTTDEAPVREPRYQ